MEPKLYQSMWSTSASPPTIPQTQTIPHFFLNKPWSFKSPFLYSFLLFAANRPLFSNWWHTTYPTKPSPSAKYSPGPLSLRSKISDSLDDHCCSSHHTAGSLLTHLSPPRSYEPLECRHRLLHTIAAPVSRVVLATLQFLICCSVAQSCPTFCHSTDCSTPSFPVLHYPSLSPWVCSDSCPLSWWCHPIILTSVTPFSSCSQSFPASGSFPTSWFFVAYYVIRITPLQPLCIKEALLFPAPFYRWENRGWRG